MKRQTIRRSVVGATAVLFHALLVFHLLFSPVIVVMAAFRGILNASFFSFLVLFAGSLFFGRAYCAWCCPGCGIQELVASCVRRPAPLTKATRIKYVIFAAWLTAIVIGYLSAGAKTVDLSFGMTDIGVTRKIVMTVGAGLIIVPLGLVFGGFASCKYACWQAPFLIVGDVLRRRAGIPGLFISANSERCTNCGRCARECPMAIDVESQVRREVWTAAECIMCGSCIDACPSHVIRYHWGRQERDSADALARDGSRS